jgi:cell fate (sporulation/competence/biofilm development) regulator YlbF (YheA/YmcA/DUF963 family)
MDLGEHSIPRNLKYSSRAKDNDIEQIRRRLRENKIAHHKFDAFLENKEGLQYYHGVYEPNNAEHIDGTEENMGTSKNLYNYILSQGHYKEFQNMKSGPKQIVRMGGFMDKDAKKNQIPLTREQKARLD